jgi:catechol 2,3-dioxygenase-like lactoylglutathione lyase family enzyme
MLGFNGIYSATMMIGAHFLLYSKDAEADRDFFRDVLGFRYVDAGHGWLIFAMPPAEVAIHPLDNDSESSESDASSIPGAEFYLMCDDLNGFIASLKEKKVECTPPEVARWGVKTKIPLPSGGTIGLYQPRHPTALKLASDFSSK